jgi:pantetheine-phosphate adenylyltransferase
VYGPTAWDANISALVVSEETISGAKSIAALREERGLSKLEVYVIDVIGAQGVVEEDIKTLKLSSTAIRAQIAHSQTQ